ncbi:stage III sporulation protein AE [Clostridium sp. KNHs214]|uniref:stage III sporulation protein AE n=1 Tax=Clostridium sp. KNHs214 TaxID=1540257 RepID=UPI0005568FBC|nr:stage III sporulation protein AE [Clostridium sp. KNHs214]
MKKIVGLIIIFTLFFTNFNVQASSKDYKEINEIASGEQMESLYNYISNMKNKYEIIQELNPKEYVMDFMKTGDGKFSIKKFGNALWSYAFREVLAAVKIMIGILILGIVSALLKNLENAFSNEKMTKVAYFACYSLVIIVVAKSFKIGVSLVNSTINTMVDFMTALIPVLLVMLASVGGVAEAAVMNPIIIVAINICSRIYVSFIIPMILMSFVLNFVNNISDDYKISNLTKIFSKVALWTQGIIMTVFVGVVSIRGITSKTLDAVTSKTAKYAVDNFVPVIGKCLSDAVSTVAGYSLLAKNALSSLGLVIILAIILLPIIKIFVIASMYKISAALIEPICDKNMVKCISNSGDSLILLMSTLISVSFMFFIMLCIIAAAGSGVLGG